MRAPRAGPRCDRRAGGSPPGGRAVSHRAPPARWRPAPRRGRRRPGSSRPTGSYQGRIALSDVEEPNHQGRRRPLTQRGGPREDGEGGHDAEDHRPRRPATVPERVREPGHERGADDQHQRTARDVMWATGALPRRFADRLQVEHREAGERAEREPERAPQQRGARGHEPQQQGGRHRGCGEHVRQVVTSGTSPKWKSRIGVTPSCAASVVPSARPSGRGITRLSRSPNGEARATSPPVAAAESWNPTDVASPGSRTSRTRTAPERTTPVDRGFAAKTPTIAITDIVPARRTDGSAPVKSR